MKIGVLVNAAAGSADQSEDLFRLVDTHDQLESYRLDEIGSCDKAVRQALDDGCEVVAAAGGDGTVHDVLNAMMRAGGSAALGVVPLGTGNDFARTLALGPDPRDAVAQLSLGRIECLDVMQVRQGDRTFYGMNAVTGGFGGEVSDSLSPELKAAFGSLAYVIGAVSMLPSMEEYEVSIGFNGQAQERADALAIVAANGRTVAGGKRVAPLANPQDGLLDVLVVKPSSLLDLADVGARLVAGNILGSRHIMHRRTPVLHLTGASSMSFNVDGEAIGTGDIEITVLPRAMPIVVGTDYHAEVEV